jgi:hypothetical protein
MASGSIVSSISRVGRYEPFDLQVSRGQITGHTTVYKFGYSTVIDGTLFPVWNIAANRVYRTTAATMTVSSSSANDTSPSGTGAHIVLIEGLDQNYNPISEQVTLAGQTAVTTTKTYLRVIGITVVDKGVNGGNVGTLYVGTGTVTTGVPAVVHELVPPGFNKEASGVYTVPAGYTAYFRVGGLSGQDTGAGYVTGRLVISNQGSPFITSAVTVFATGQVNYDFPYPIAIPEKSDIEARAITSSGTNTVSSYFGMILIKNDGQT